MSFIFRDIGNKAWWNTPHADFPWLREDDLVADVFKGLATKRGTLSVFSVDEELVNLRHVAAALACTRQSVKDVDYVLVPATIIEANFEVSRTPGDTADDAVNGWHLDIINLTQAKLNELLCIFRDHRETLGRLKKKKIEAQIRENLKKGYINFADIDDNLQSKFSSSSVN